MFFSVIIPCYNEAENIPLLIEKCKKITAKNIEMILVNNGSTDDSFNIITRLIKNSTNIKLINVTKNIGYGHGILKGLESARGDILGWTHADLQTDLNDVLLGFKFFQNDKNIFVKGRRIKRALKDNVFTIGMSIFETILFQKFFWDINAQPNLFNRSFYEKWKNPPLDFSLDLYVYYLALKTKLKMKRFNVTFEDRLFGHSKWNINWSSKIKFIIRTLKFSVILIRNNEK